MAVSAGIDVVEIAEVRESLRRFGDRYLRRLFTPAEIAECAGRRRPVLLASCFAAKEAAKKALVATGDVAGWQSIEVGGLPSGRPVLHLSGEVATLAKRYGVLGVDLSVGATRSYAAAVVIVETRDIDSQTQ